MKKDKSKILGIGCIIFAVFMIVISGIQYLNKEKKSEEKRYDSEFYEQTADYNFDDADNSIGESETTTVTETAEEELDDNVEPRKRGRRKCRKSRKKPDSAAESVE